MSIQITINDTDRTGYVYYQGQMSWDLVRGARGQCQLPLKINFGDPYLPAIGDAVRVYEIIDSSPPVSTRVWSGTGEQLEIKWIGNGGLKVATLTAVTLEQMFDTKQLQNVTYENQNAGDIVTNLLGKSGVTAVTAGTIQAGVNIAGINVTQISAAFDQLALESGFVWYVDPSDEKLYFHEPTARAAAWTITAALFDSIDWIQSRSDQRQQQDMAGGGASVQFDEATGAFAGDGSTTSFDLGTVPSAIIGVSIGRESQATATGTFSGQPAPGDTVTIAQPPFFSTTYTFVSALDNTVANQVLIGATAADTCANLASAINATSDGKGITYSSPTLHSPIVYVFPFPTGATLTVNAGALGPIGNDNTISDTSANFSWSGATLLGGEELTPAGLGLTFTVSWVPGGSIITCTPPMPFGWWMEVVYVTSAVNGSVTVVGDPIPVAQMQRDTLHAMLSAAAQLQLAQSVVSPTTGFGGVPIQIVIGTDKPGMEIARLATVSMAAPLGAGSFLDGNWIVTEVQAALIPGKQKLPEPKGHFRYTIHLISQLAVPNHVSTWEQLANVGSGTGKTPSLPFNASISSAPATYDHFRFQIAETIEGITNPGLTTGTKQAVRTSPHPGSLTMCTLYFLTQPTTTDCIVDVLQNGASIFGATKMIFPHPTSPMVEQKLFASPPHLVAEGDVFTLDIIQADATAKDGTLDLEMIISTVA